MSSDDESDEAYESEYATDEELDGKKSIPNSGKDAEAAEQKDEKLAKDSVAEKQALHLIESTAPISVIDKRLLEELLLVVQNLGFVDEDGSFLRGADCQQWLNDLRNALARDDSDRRHVSNFIGTWNVLPKKLVPLMKASKDDKPLILTMLKIFFMLTKPISRTASKDACQLVDPKAGEISRKNMLKRKQNAEAQIQNLQSHKASFVDAELVSIMVDCMQEAVSHTGSSRTDDQRLTVELVLALVRNILAIPEAEATDGSGGTPEYTHEELICVLQDELMLEVIMLLAQDIEARENKSLNLVIMEILFHLTERQDPRKVAKYMNNSAVDKTNQKSMDITAPTASNSKLHKQEKMVPRGSSIGLKQQLLIEKAQRNKALQSRSRHSHFGGVLLLDSVAMGKTKDGSGQRSVTTLYQNDPMAAMKKPSMRRDRKRLPFNARNNGNVKQKKFSQIGQRAEMALGKFCDGFFSEAYQLFMSNIKGEFRRESSRLSPDEDRVVFFRLTRFFLMTRRYSRANSYSSIAVKQVPSTQTNDNSDNNGLDAGSSASSSSSQSMKPSVDTGIVASSMDLFSFNLVFTAVDEMVAEKKYAGLEYACELLLEMTHMLWHMRSNSTELGGGLRRIALGLMTQIFFGADPKDKLHFLFRSWQPATFTKQFLANLIELGYMTFKVLELRSRSDDLIIDKHIEAELKVASIFDMYSYVKKIATADVIETHRILLECFATNEPRQNHFCVSFFRRLCTTQLREHDENDSENAEFRPNGASKSVDSNKKVRGDFMATFEPLLYNIPILSLCEKVLNSPCVMGIETRVVFAELRMFCETVVRHFAKLAKSNPVLFVDALFTQPALQRIKFCESAHLHYVDAEQLVALKAQRRTDRGSTDDNIAMDNFDLQVEAEKLLSSFMQKESTMRTRASMSPTKGALGGELDDSDAENTLQRDEQALATSSSSSSSSSSGIVDSKVRVLEEEEEEEGFDLEDEALAAAAPKRKRKKVRKEGARGSKWTEDDDALLRVEHKKYRDSASMLEILCELEYFKAKGRTKGQIEKRIRTLKLHFAYEEDNEDQESDMEESAEEDDKSLNQDSEVEDMDEEASGTSDNTQLQNDEVLADGEAASSEKQTVTPDKITLSTETSSTVTPEHVENQAETNDLANETNPVLSTSDELIADERDGSSALTAMDVNDGVEAHFDKIDEVEDAEDMEPLNLLTKRKFKKSRKGKRIIKKMKPSGEIVGGASAPSLASELVDSEED